MYAGTRVLEDRARLRNVIAFRHNNQFGAVQSFAIAVLEIWHMSVASASFWADSRSETTSICWSAVAYTSCARHHR
jgi:hypothetical protein